MANTTMQTTKRQRASVSRNKTGCGTCRIRHKRCDEAKPICENCQSTGRICEGYVDLANGRHYGGHPPRRILDGVTGTVSIAAGLSSGPLFADQHEAQGFQFFKTATGIQLANSLRDHRWTTSLLQLSHQDPAIRHAVIAAGTMSRRYEANELSVGDDALANNFHNTAMRQYTKAIANLRSQLGLNLSGSNAPSANALACCLLLTIFEFMQGNAENMLIHLSTAVRLADAVVMSPVVEPLLYLLTMTDMIAVLWLNLDRAYFNIPLQFQQLSIGPLPPPLFSDLAKLNEDLADIENDIMTLSHAVACLREDPPGLNTKLLITTSITPITYSYVLQVRQVIQSRLDLWYREFTRISPNNKEDVMLRRSLLQANYLLVVLKLDAIQTVGQSPMVPATQKSAADPEQQNIERHTEILNLTEAALATGHPVSRYDLDQGERELVDFGLVPLFSFRNSFIHPVFFVAQKAPNISLRWRAIRLLTDKPWREGAWDSAAMGLIAIRLLKAHDADTTSS